MPHHETPQFIKATDAARCIGISRKTMYFWIARGSLPVHRFGRTIRIDREDLAKFIESSRLNDFATSRELAAQNALLGSFSTNRGQEDNETPHQQDIAGGGLNARLRS